MPRNSLIGKFVGILAICAWVFASGNILVGHAAPLAPSNSAWKVSVIDAAGGDTGYYTSLAIDRQDKLHVSYIDHANHLLKYATDQSGEWVTSTVTDQISDLSTTSIAVDSKGKVYIAYAHHGWGDPEMAVRDLNGTWSFPNLKIYENVGGGVSIAIDANDVVHVAATTATTSGPVTTSHLAYTDNSGGSFSTAQDAWLCMQGATVQLGAPSISLDRNGQSYITLVDGTYLVYATKLTGSWACDYLGDANLNAVFFSNRYSANDAGGVVHFASLNGVGSTSLALDKNDQARIADYHNGCLRYTTGTVGAYQSTDVDCTSASVGKYNSIAMDSHGAVHIVYFDETHGSLKYATIPGSQPLFLPLLQR